MEKYYSVQLIIVKLEALKIPQYNIPIIIEIIFVRLHTVNKIIE